MPTSPQPPCTMAGCPHRAVRFGRCDAHQRPRQRAPDTRPNSSQRGYGSTWQTRRSSFLARHPWCVQCSEPAVDVDHIIPRSRGGTDDESNLQAYCHRCHSQKTARQDGGGWHHGS